MHRDRTIARKSRDLQRLRWGNLALSVVSSVAALLFGNALLQSDAGIFKAIYGIAALGFTGAAFMGAVLHRRLSRYEDLLSSPEPSTIRQVEEFSFGGVVVRGGKVSSVVMRPVNIRGLRSREATFHTWKNQEVLKGDT